MALSPKGDGSGMLCRLWVCNRMRFRFIFYQDIMRVQDKKIRYANYRVAVDGDIAIRFLSNLSQNASYLVPNSRRTLIG